MTQIVVTLVLALCAALAGYGYGHQNGSAGVQAKWATEKAELATRKSANITAQREKEATLQANMDKLRTEKNNELARLNRHVRALSDSLRNRPERPSSLAVPEVASAGDGASGCTGATLYRSDSEFLIRFSERADTLRLALIQCQKAYQDASD